jgi:hypothetical protein
MMGPYIVNSNYLVENSADCQVTPAAQPNLQLLGLGLEIGRCWVSHFAITLAKCRLG